MYGETYKQIETSVNLYDARRRSHPQHPPTHHRTLVRVVRKSSQRSTTNPLRLIEKLRCNRLWNPLRSSSNPRNPRLPAELPNNRLHRVTALSCSSQKWQLSSTSLRTTRRLGHDPRLNS